jgi:hypothetical protein
MKERHKMKKERHKKHKSVTALRGEVTLMTLATLFPLLLQTRGS